MLNIGRLALASVSAWAIAAPAMAQDAGDTAGAGFESADIIVEARRREESLQDVPLVVNAVTSEALEKLNLRNFQDVAALVPGLSLVPNANGIGTQSSIRGVNHDVNVSGENGTIQYYRNDAPTASSFIFQTMYDVAQIEVLRGPQGTLRGRSTPSGSITIATRQPDLSEAGGYLNGTMGSADLKNFNGAINLPIITDKLGVRVAGLYKFDRGNRVHALTGDTLPRNEAESLRVTVRAEPFDFFRAGFLYEVIDTETLRFGQVQSYNLLDPSFVPSTRAGVTTDFGTIRPKDFRAIRGDPGMNEQNFKFYNWNAELDLAGQRLIYVGSRLEQTYHSNGVADAGLFFPTLVPAQETLTGGPVTSHEVRLQNVERIADMFDYVAGFFRYKVSTSTILSSRTLLQLKGQANPENIIIPLGSPNIQDTPIYLPKGTPVEESFFGNVTAHIGESTEISGGLRRIKFTDFRDGLFINCSEAQYLAGGCTRQNGTQTDTNEKKTIYSVSVKHRFNDGLMVYAATGSSWRPPVIAIGDFTNAPYTPNEVAHVTLGSETSKSYEIGIKSNWFDKKLLANVTYYHQKYKNYPFRAAGAGVTFINVNRGGAPEIGNFNFISAVPVKVDGVEAELAFNPSRRFSLGAVINYSKSVIGDAVLACLDALNNASGAVGSDGIPDVAIPTLAQIQQAYGSERLAECPGGGQSATFQPKWSGTVQGEYLHPLTDSLDGYLRGLFAWRGKTGNDPNNRFDDVDAYGILNLYAGLRDPDGAWELSFYAKNVFDTAKILTRNDVPVDTSVTDVILADVNPAPGFTPPAFAPQVPIGTSSTTYRSPYSGVTVTPPREFGVNLILRFGSR